MIGYIHIKSEFNAFLDYWEITTHRKYLSIIPIIHTKKWCKLSPLGGYSLAGRHIYFDTCITFIFIFQSCLIKIKMNSCVVSMKPDITRHTSLHCDCWYNNCHNNGTTNYCLSFKTKCVIIINVFDFIISVFAIVISIASMIYAICSKRKKRNSVSWKL